MFIPIFPVLVVVKTYYTSTSRNASPTLCFERTSRGLQKKLQVYIFYLYFFKVCEKRLLKYCGRNNLLSENQVEDFTSKKPTTTVMLKIIETIIYNLEACHHLQFYLIQAGLLVVLEYDLILQKLEDTGWIKLQRNGLKVTRGRNQMLKMRNLQKEKKSKFLLALCRKDPQYLVQYSLYSSWMKCQITWARCAPPFFVCWWYYPAFGPTNSGFSTNGIQHRPHGIWILLKWVWPGSKPTENPAR